MSESLPSGVELSNNMRTRLERRITELERQNNYLCKQIGRLNSKLNQAYRDIANEKSAAMKKLRTSVLRHEL